MLTHGLCRHFRRLLHLRRNRDERVARDAASRHGSFSAIYVYRAPRDVGNVSKRAPATSRGSASPQTARENLKNTKLLNAHCQILKKQWQF